MSVVCLGLAAGCTVYQLEPVEPLAFSQRERSGVLYGTVRKANLVFAVDRSGSMEDPVNPACPVGPLCPTRWSELRRAMEDFLARQGELARMGLLLFPRQGGATVEAQCAGPSLDEPGGLAVPIPDTADVPAQLRAAALQISSALQASAPAGGTPTAQTLRLLAQYPALTAQDGRQDVVVLLTDGLPNCNFQNAASGEVPGSGCQCVSSPCTGALARAGCLDDGDAVAAVTALRERGILTGVVGFGAALDNPQGAAVLNRMAEQGGLARVCTGVDCPRFYQANTADELVRALEAISRALPAEPCVFTLDAEPSSPELVSVLLDGQALPRGDASWRYERLDGQPRIAFLGSVCERIVATPDAEPLPVVVRVVTSPGR